MGRVESQIEIGAPLERVFAFVANPKNYEKMFAGAEVKVEMVSKGPIGVGTSYRLSAVLGGRKVDVHLHEYVEFEENRRFVDCEVKGALKREELIFVFDSTDRGTKVTASIDYELPGSVLGMVLDRLMVRKEMERFLKGGVQKAKEILEET